MMRRLVLQIPVLAAAAVISALLGCASAQAIVVDMNPAAQGPTGATGPQLSVPYGGSDQGDYYGVAMVPGGDGTLTSAGVPVVSTAGACTDPWLSSDLRLPPTALCWHGSSNGTGDASHTVMHANETFALTWDPNHGYWQGTVNYLEQFLQNVAGASGSLSSPFAITSQYADGNPDSVNSANTIGHAENTSVYGGGCVDFGQAGGATCTLGGTTESTAGNNYPTAAADTCPVNGTNEFAEFTSGVFVNGVPNTTCITDQAIRAEVTAMQQQLSPTVKAGYSQLVNVLLPPGVEVCLTQGSSLCSANGGTSAQFCSYHGVVGGIAYTVLPWVVNTSCEEPDLKFLTSQTPNGELASDAGARLVSPLSQAEIAAIVNPNLNGWFAAGGGEIDDNSYNGTGTGCVPLDQGRDAVTIGGTLYDLQHEFNNAGLIQTDPNSQVCAPQVVLAPTFVVPTNVNAGDTVVLDGSATASTLIVPKANYVWSFGDGSAQQTGPSANHVFAKGGTFQIKLTVTDRGGNTASVTEPITVNGPSGQPPKPPTPSSAGKSGLQARIQLLPQALRGVLRSGVRLLVDSSAPAAGIATISIPRRAAHRAHIHVRGRHRSIVIGRGTIGSLNQGPNNLRLRVTHRLIRKLEHLHHVTITVRLTLFSSSREQIAVDAAGRY